MDDGLDEPLPKLYPLARVKAATERPDGLGGFVDGPGQRGSARCDRTGARVNSGVRRVASVAFRLPRRRRPGASLNRATRKESKQARRERLLSGLVNRTP